MSDCPKPDGTIPAADNYASVIHYTSDEGIAALRSSGYIAFETYNSETKYLKSAADWNETDNYQMYFMSLTNPVKRIYRFDFANERDLAVVKELLESQSIVKVTRKVAIASSILARRHQIEIHSVVDLTASMYLVNQVGLNSGNLVNARIVDDIGDTVQVNMLRLAKVWLRLYGSLYCNLIAMTKNHLNLFRTFHLE